MHRRFTEYDRLKIEQFTRLFEELGVPEPEERAKEAVEANCLLNEDAIEFVFPPAEAERLDTPAGAVPMDMGAESKTDGDAQRSSRDDMFRLTAYLEPNRKDVREFEIDRNCSMQDLRDKLAEVLELSPYVTSILIMQDGLLLATTHLLRNGGRLAVEITGQLRDIETEPVEVTNVGNLEYLDSEAYSHYNEHIQDVLLQLARECPRWRRIRGDGNCFYRAYIVGVFEHAFSLLKEERTAFLQQLESKLSASLFMTTRDLGSLKKVFKMLSKECTSTKLFDMMNGDIVDCDALLVWACRCAIAEYIFRNQEAAMEGDIVVKDIIKANFDQSVEDFCKHVVLAMGNEAEDLILPVAPRALGVPLVVCMVHSDKHVQLQQLRYHPSADAQQVGEEESVNAVYVLFRPGHYDLLYSRRQAVLPMKSVDDYLASSSSTREAARTTTASSSSETGRYGYLRQSAFQRALEMMLSMERRALHQDLCNLLQNIQSSPDCLAHVRNIADAFPSYADVRYPVYELSKLAQLDEIRAANDLIQRAKGGGDGSDASVLQQLLQQLATCLAEIERVYPELQRPRSAQIPAASPSLKPTDVAVKEEWNAVDAAASPGKPAAQLSQETVEPSIDDIRTFYQSCDQTTRRALLDDLHQLNTEIAYPISLSSKHVAQVFPRTNALDRSIWTEIQASAIVKFIVAKLVNLREEVMSISGRTPSIAVLREFVNKLLDEFEHPSTSGSQPGADLIQPSSSRRLEKQDSLMQTIPKTVTLSNVSWGIEPASPAPRVSAKSVKIFLLSFTERVATVRLTQLVRLPRRTAYYVELDFHDSDVRIESIEAVLNSTERAISHQMLEVTPARSTARLTPALCSSTHSSENELRLKIRGSELVAGGTFTLFEARLVPADARW